MAKSAFRRQSAGDRTFDLVNIALVTVILLVVLFPLWFVVIASISDPMKVAGGKILFLPSGINIQGYRMVFRDSNILNGYRNTLLYTALGTSINIVLTVCAAYPLSRKDWVGRGFFMAILMITMFFSGGLIPTYLIMSAAGLVNTIWAMVIPGAVSVYNTVVMRTYFTNSIPLEIQEAAMADGASNISLLLRIVLPLSKPILAVISLFYGVVHWNAFFNALIYLSRSTLYPLQLVLRTILIQNQVSQDMVGEVDTLANRVMMAEIIKYALIIVSTLPMMAFYPFLQRYFIKGVMIGAVKG